MKWPMGTMAGLFILVAVARPGPAWGQIGFGPGQSMDPIAVLNEARASQAPATPEAAIAGYSAGNNPRADRIEAANFKGNYQGYAPWCWASATEMVLHQCGFKVDGVEKRTCQIVSDMIGKDCCGLFTPEACWVAGRDTRMYEIYGLPYVREGAVPEAVIKAIRANRLAVLILRRAAYGGSGHAVVVHGVIDAQKGDTMIFEIYDPAQGEVRLSAASLMRDGYDGRFVWSETHFLQTAAADSAALLPTTAGNSHQQANVHAEPMSMSTAAAQ